MSMIKTIFTSLFVFICLSVIGQNTYRFSQFNFAKSVYNPATVAVDANFSVDLLYRNQWNGVEGSPQTIAFNTAYEIIPSMAVGFNFYNDRIGLHQTNSFSGMYAYRINFDRRKYLSFGAGIGVDNISWNLNEAFTTQANDPAFSTGYSKFMFNSSVGIYYRSPRFYVGASIPQMFQTSLVGPDKGFRPARFHYMLLSGYYFEIGREFVLHPSIQVRMTMNAPIQGDLVIRGITKNFGISAGYRSENSLIVGLDYMYAERYRIGYSFNYDVGSLARVKGASHEIYLGFGLPYYFNGNQVDRRRYVSKPGGFKRNYKRGAQKKRLPRL